jgi:hypothetical protein
MFFFQCNFTKGCGSKEITKLQDDLILTTCNLETIFSPSFLYNAPLDHSYCSRDEVPRPFVSLLDISISKVHDSSKKYVHNRSHSEGCMFQGWTTE